MVSGLKTSAAAMDAQAERLAVLANNLANAGAVGFKANHPSFFQLLSSPRAAGSVTPADPAAPLLIPTAMQATIDFSAGSFRETGNALDLAIEGSGFFVVGSTDTPRLTRAGAFTRTPAGVLATLDGTPVLDARRRPLQLPDGGAVEVSADGTVRVGGASVGQLLVVDVPLDALTRDEAGRFIAPADVPLEASRTSQIRQGLLELSNVNPVLTMVEMIDALRVYEAAQRTARGIDETLGRAVNDVGRP